jgi:NTE family protein
MCTLSLQSGWINNQQAMRKIGVALGAGGARGLAHIVVLQAFEELGVTPSVVSGTSIGAVVGAALAAGLSSEEMKSAVAKLLAPGRRRSWTFYDTTDFKVAAILLDPTMEAGGLIKGEKFLRFLQDTIRVTRFEDLRIPLHVVATDYWRREQVVFRRGNLMKAVRASYSMPGLFTPLRIGKNLLVDGGLMNPLPYDIIRQKCDITVAIDVSVSETLKKSETPRAQEVLFSAFQILQNSIVREKLRQTQPDILIRTNIKNVRALEFTKAESIYEQAVPAKEKLKRKLVLALK